MRSTALRADAMLLAVAALWGAGFVAQKDAMDSVGPFAFNAARYAIGAALLIFPVVLRRRSSPLTRKTLLAGALLGIVMFAAASLQQTGIVTATASRTAFLTGLYVLIVPAIGLIFRQRITIGHVAGGVLAVVGLAMLSGQGSGDILSGLTSGDRLVLGSAGLWALHVVLTGHFAPKADPFVLAWTQFVTVAGLSACASIPSETTTLAGLAAAWLPIIYSGALVIALAFTLQIIAQRDAPPAHAAVIMSLEALFGAVFGVLLLKEMLSAWEIAGCATMFAGMLVSQLFRGKHAGPVKPPPVEHP